MTQTNIEVETKDGAVVLSILLPEGVVRIQLTPKQTRLLAWTMKSVALKTEQEWQ